MTHMPMLQRLLPLTAIIMAASVGGAEPPAEPAGNVRLGGKLAVTAAEGARITAATLTTAQGKPYLIEMDTPGTDLARVMFGQDVSIRGRVTECNGQAWLRVTGFAEEKYSAAHELWRRSRCNACAFQFGALHAAEPSDLRGATAVAGRLYPGKPSFFTMARDRRYLWLAADAAIYQVDLAARALVKTHDRTAGLPDQPVLDLASDGTTLWILSRNAAFALPIGHDKVLALPGGGWDFARLLAGAHAAWVIADTGAFRYTSPTQQPERFPAPPTGPRIAAAIRKGLWFPTWKQNTAFFLARPTAVGGRLYVESFGDVFELADGAWTRALAGAGQIQAGRGRLWALTADGLAERDPQSGSNTLHAVPEIAGGRLTGLLVTDAEAWLTAEPRATHATNQADGGILRLGLADGRRQAWKTIAGLDARHAVVQAGEDGAVWAVTHQGAEKVLAAHPGMTYVEKTLFTANHFGLHRWDATAGAWQTLPLAGTNLEQRYICGQDGQGQDGVIALQALDRLCVNGDRIFAVTRLVPLGAFSGYWPCVNQAAVRADGGEWRAALEHRPADLNLEGEQPLVLNISNKGEMILKAVGHDDVLDLFAAHGHTWAVTEGTVAWFDPAERAWRKLVELGFNFYWRPTAILDEPDAVFVGSDRGLVSRLDPATGRWRLVGGLKGRTIARLARRDGRLLAVGGPAPLGQLPARMPGCPALTDADAAAWDGREWSAAPVPEAATESSDTSWQFRPLKEPERRGPFLREQAIGNLLWGPKAGTNGPSVPRFYVKEVYAPRFLAFSGNGRRLWLSTFSGLLRVDVPAEEQAHAP